MTAERKLKAVQRITGQILRLNRKQKQGGEIKLLADHPIGWMPPKKRRLIVKRIRLIETLSKF